MTAIAPVIAAPSMRSSLAIWRAFAHAPQTDSVLERLAREAPTTLACMHGSAWRGDGARLLRELAATLLRPAAAAAS